MKRFLLALLVVLAAGATAHRASAADMPLLKAPPPVVLNWDGLYVGLEAGAKWSQDRFTTTCVEDAPLFVCGSPLNAIVFPGAPDASSRTPFRPSAHGSAAISATTGSSETGWAALRPTGHSSIGPAVLSGSWGAAQPPAPELRQARRSRIPRASPSDTTQAFALGWGTWPHPIFCSTAPEVSRFSRSRLI